jgi:hypothetical protein
MAAPLPPLQSPGPAQYGWLIHFCGRPLQSEPTPSLPESIKGQDPSVRLSNILCNGWLYGFPPHGAKQPREYGPGMMPPPGAIQPMLCLSESPPARLHWLLNIRGWQPWGLFFLRQRVYDIGGGPVWYIRDEQFRYLRDDQKPWVARLHTGPLGRSDWLHEREWRIPLPVEPDSGAHTQFLGASPGSVGVLHLSIITPVVILIGRSDWQPANPSTPLWQYTLRLWGDPTQLLCLNPITNQR